MIDRLRSNLGPQMHESCFGWSPVAPLDFQLAIERIAFEYWAKVIAAMPSQYGDNIWNRACRLRQGDSYGVATVDEASSASCSLVVMNASNVQCEASQFGSASDHVSSDYFDSLPWNR